MSEEKLKALRMSLDNQEELLQFLISFIEDVSEKKAINKIFVIWRLKSLLPRLFLVADYTSRSSRRFPAGFFFAKLKIGFILNKPFPFNFTGEK